MIWNEHVSCSWEKARISIQSFSPSNFLTLYKSQIRPSLENCSHICGAAAPTTLSILDAVQRRAIGLIGDPAVTCHLQPLSHRRAVGDLSLFYRYSNGFCSSELTSIIPLLSKPAGCTRGTSSSHPKVVVLHISRTEPYDRVFVTRVSRAWTRIAAEQSHLSRIEFYQNFIRDKFPVRHEKTKTITG
nr:unnamed protein product [Callosobruchus chinensis]